MTYSPISSVKKTSQHGQAGQGSNNAGSNNNQNNMVAIGSHLRIPPNHIDSEKAVLGSIMLRPDAMNEIMDFTSSKSFYSERHRKIYETMLELFTENSPIDMLSLRSRLEEKRMLDSVGGANYLTEIVHMVPSSANIKHYAEIVQKKHMMRRLIEAGDFVTQIGYDENGPLDELLDKAEKSIYDVTNFTTSHRFIEIKEKLTEAWDRIDDLHKTKDQVRGVPTGFQALDDKLAGLQKSDLIILAARPSMGKTSLALDIARQAAIIHNVPVGIFSLEMSSHQLIDRMLAAQSRVDAWKLRTGKLTLDSDFESIHKSLEILSKAPIFVDDQPGSNILKMRSVARRLKSERGLGLIIVDYLQLMTPTQSHGSDNLVQQTTEISRSLKQLARELDVPVLALSQLSRAVEQRGGRPRLSDLRDSGSIEQDADVVMFIHNEDRYKENQAERTNVTEILIEKHRNGPTGVAKLYFDKQKSTFMNLEKGEFGDFDNAGGGGGGETASNQDFF